MLNAQDLYDHVRRYSNSCFLHAALELILDTLYPIMQHQMINWRNTALMTYPVLTPTITSRSRKYMGAIDIDAVSVPTLSYNYFLLNFLLLLYVLLYCYSFYYTFKLFYICPTLLVIIFLHLLYQPADMIILFRYIRCSLLSSSLFNCCLRRYTNLHVISVVVKFNCNYITSF